MKFSYSMAERIAQPIAKMLYQRGYRKIDDILNYIQSVLDSHLESDIAESIMLEISNGIYDVGSEVSNESKE